MREKAPRQSQRSVREAGRTNFNAATKPTMSNQRLVLIETSYGTGILFDQKDTVQAYQILSRATIVSTSGRIVPSAKDDIDIKLISPSRLMTVEEFKEEEKKARIVAAEPYPEIPQSAADENVNF